MTIGEYTAVRWEKYGKFRIYVSKRGKELGYIESGKWQGKQLLNPDHLGELSITEFVQRFVEQADHRPEQLLAHLAISQERNTKTRVCPDCGAPMVQDGGAPYCERCEG